MWVMDAKELFFERYRGFQEYPAILLDGMTEQQLRGAPHPALNPIVWILWHTARCEDMGINRLLVDRAQMLNEDSWVSRLNGPERQIGTGMTKPEVEQLAEQLDLAELLAYRTAVTERTVEVLEGLLTEELMQKLSVDRLRQVFTDEGAGGTAASGSATCTRGTRRAGLWVTSRSRTTITTLGRRLRYAQCMACPIRRKRSVST